jgi:hypothetical protein
MLRQHSRIILSHSLGLLSLLTAARAAAGFGQAANQPPSVRQVDFRNFTYRPACLGLDGKTPPIRVKDGEYSRDNGVEDRVYFKVVDVVFGDLDGDSQEEAIVETVCNTGGTGNFSDGIIFKLKNGRPAPVATLGMGDRADGGIHKIAVENGLIKVGRYGGSSGACCPDYVDTYTHKLAGGKLVDVGKPVRGDFVDAEGYRAVRRVRFERGASSATLKGATKGTSEYILGARAGQTLSVSSSGGGYTLELRADTGDELPQPVAGKPFSVKLPKNGDYRVVVSAADEKKPATYTLEVGIR